MLDLDVGFLADPKGIVQTFYDSPDIDIFVQVMLNIAEAVNVTFVCLHSKMSSENILNESLE
jgi:hypothetical protein